MTEPCSPCTNYEHIAQDDRTLPKSRNHRYRRHEGINAEFAMAERGTLHWLRLRHEIPSNTESLHSPRSVTNSYVNLCIF